MSGLRALFALLKPELYRWRLAIYVTGVIWAFLAAAEIIEGEWRGAFIALAISAAYFCFYEKCLTWKAKP